jgi:predicted ATPase
MDTLQLTASLDLEPTFVLPEWRSPMIGRRAELQRVQELLLRADVWLVTITGPGGVGKSRLAHAAASALLPEFDAAVAWVSLASATTSELAIETLARALGILAPGVDTGQATGRALEGCRALLVLDNVEQVPDFAPFIAHLAQTNPLLKVLVTSRTPLRLGGERDVALLPFSTPPPDQRPGLTAAGLKGNDAVELFVERAQAVDQTFVLSDDNAAAIAEICRRLDGLPLAIELAAARVRLLPPEALAPRMAQSLDLLTTGPRDAPARQQTPRNTIRWSYDLLSVEEQRLFRRLSVFSGGFSLDAAQAICDAGIDTLELVSSLLDHSLLIRLDRPGEPRFQMLETIRAFAADMLSDPEERRAIRDAHAAWFAGRIARSADRKSRNPDWLNLIDREIGNIRAAMTWLESERNAELLLSMCNEMSDWWQGRGTIREGRACFVRAFAIDAPLTGEVRIDGLLNAAWFSSRSGDYQEARRQVDLVQQENVGSTSTLTQIANETVQGAILFKEGEFQQSLKHMQRAQVLVEAAGLHARKPGVRFNLGVIAKVLDDPEGARSHHEQGLREATDPVMRSLHAVALADLDL